MANQEHIIHPAEVHEKPTILTLLTGSIAEGTAGITASVLAILGLSNILPYAMLYIATIVIGAAFLSNGISLAVRFSSLISETEEEGMVSRAEIGSGMSAEGLAGAAGITLGILALVGIVSEVLIAVATIIFGAAIILSIGINYRLNTFGLTSRYKSSSSQLLAREMMTAAADTQLLIGLAAITLGILALIGIFPLILTFVALLTIGIANFLSGIARSARFSHY